MAFQRPGLLRYGVVGVPLFVWGLLVLSPRLSLGPIGALLIFMGFYKWTMDTLALLNEFVLKVVHHRQTARLQAWSNWIREDLTSHPYQWLRPEFVPPAPYLVCKPQDSPNGSGILVQPALIFIFVKAWMPHFAGMGTLLSPLKPFLILLGIIIFHRKPYWIFPYLLVRSFMKLPWPRNPLLAVLMAGLGNEIKALSLSWFVGLALVLRQIEVAGRWLQGLLDAFFAMIPKAEGDSTALGQRPSMCLAGCLSALGLGSSGPS